MAGEVIQLGARLRQRREELGLSQAQAARELDVARTAYRLWEMEAARPSPDRWRLIAKWLGLSVTAMLLADELIDEQEALDARTAARAGGLTSEAWDERSSASAGDFFSQERSMIADQLRDGNISPVEATSLRRVLNRLQRAAGDAPHGWHPGQFRKRFPKSNLTPALSRGALAATAVGIPTEQFDKAALLITELVTNSVKHSRSSWVEVDVILTVDRLRIEVSDQDNRPVRPRTADKNGGWGLTLLGALASRWGVERRTDCKTVWLELDLAETPADT
jgi:transcriptional regulator with XRE-family HTH domain/anti-sigma regulatory factor (Ser/Thr protein kinase)